jgi:serine protease Do
MLGFLVILIAMVNPVAAQPADFSEAAERVMPGVVSIKVTKRSRIPQTSQFEEEFLRHFFGREYPGKGGRRGQAQQGQGSGFIINKEGYILTNNHVVGGADEIEVNLYDGRKLQAHLVGADDKSDVAVIKVDDPDLPTLKLGNSKNLKIGQWVLAVGNPFGLSATLTVGVISATGRAGMGITDYEEFIQTDAAINPGNSGGPLLNIKGEVIGINTAIYSRSGGYMGIGFAIPINMALKIKDQLIQYGEVRRGKIGAYIQELTPEVARGLGLKHTNGVLISDVIPDSPAERGGLRAGDVVLSLGRESISSAATFRNRVSLSQPQSIVELTIMRRGAQEKLNIRIGSLNPSSTKQRQVVKAKPRSVRADEYGLEIENLSIKAKRSLRLRSDGGVMIAGVRPGSVADKAGLRPGQAVLSVNQTKIKNVRSFKKIVSRAKGALLLQVKSDRGVRFIVLSK